MKIALYTDILCHGMDLSKPYLGNPGIGGTEYEFVMLAYALVKFSDCEVNLYCREESNIYPDGVRTHIFRDYPDLIEQVKSDSNNIFVIKASDDPDIYDISKEAGLNVVAWAHNFIYGDIMNMFARNPAVKRIVMVGREEYDYYIDHPAITKSTFIHNMFDGSHFRYRDDPCEPIVTYTGGLYRSKGFHVLASMWKDILKEVPGAKLYVIGDGRLYNKDAVMGAYGLADANYEPLFMRHLTDGGGKLLPSVKFLGRMGAEKAEIYYKTSVGAVMNIIHETFGIVALDMESCGVPVVARANCGLFDTVKHGGTGFLGRNAEEIRKYIILLLKDRELNTRLGRQAKEFAEKSFLPEAVIKQWLKLFDDILNGRPCEYIPPSRNSPAIKLILRANRWFRKHYIPFPPVSTLTPMTIKRTAGKIIQRFRKFFSRP